MDVRLSIKLDRSGARSARLCGGDIARNRKAAHVPVRITWWRRLRQHDRVETLEAKVRALEADAAQPRPTTSSSPGERRLRGLVLSAGPTVAVLTMLFFTDPDSPGARASALLVVVGVAAATAGAIDRFARGSVCARAGEAAQGRRRR